MCYIFNSLFLKASLNARIIINNKVVTGGSIIPDPMVAVDTDIDIDIMTHIHSFIIFHS